MPTDLFFDRHRHRNGVQRIVGRIAGGCYDFIDNVDSTKDFPEHGIAPVQAAVIAYANKKLRAVVVKISGAVAFARHFRHGDGAPLMRAVVRFRREKVPGSACPMDRPVRLLTQRVAALNEKTWHDAMERGAIEEAHLGKVDKILHVPRSLIRIKSDFDLAELRKDSGARIFLLKLHHGG